MELREYWFIFRKWWWLFALCTLLGAGTAFAASMRMEPTYEASTLVMIGGALETSSVSSGELRTSMELAQTYAELVKTRPVLQAAKKEMGLPANKIIDVSVSILPETQLLRITVKDNSAERAAATANEIAEQLIQQSPSAPEREEQAYREFVRGQLQELEGEIANLSEAVIEAENSASPEELVRLQEELAQRRSNYSSMLSFMADSSVNFLRVFEAAEVPPNPVAPKIFQNTVLAAVVGAMLAGGAAFLFEYLDDTVKGPEIEQTFGVPVLANVAELEANGIEPRRAMLGHPKSAFAEAFQVLRTNLRYSLPEEDDGQSEAGRAFVVTSVEPAVGKTTTVDNLSIALARTGQRVIMVDADMRRPDLHKLWDVPNEEGLSSLLVGDVQDVDSVLHSTEVEGLQVLPCGPTPPSPAELLSSERMRNVVKALLAQADYVLVDSPPLFVGADASILASAATGTILVLGSGRTSLPSVAQAIDMLNKVEAHLIGVVVNRVQVGRRAGYYYSGYHGYYYQYYDSYGEDGEERRRKGRERAGIAKKLRGLLRRE